MKKNVFSERQNISCFQRSLSRTRNWAYVLPRQLQYEDVYKLPCDPNIYSQIDCDAVKFMGRS
jgi:hypothetical protein